MARSGPVTKDTSTIALGLTQIRVGQAAANISNPNSCLLPANSMGAMAETKFTSQVEYWKLSSGYPALEDISLPQSESCKMEIAFKEITPFNLAIARGLDPYAVSGVKKALGAAAGVNSGVSVFKSVAGTINQTLNLTVDNTNCAFDTFTITFTSASAYSVQGFMSGNLTGAGAIASSSSFTLGALAQFTIPANFFTGTWAAGDMARFSVMLDGFSNNHAGDIGLGAMKAPDYVRMESVYTYPNQYNHMYIIFPRANVTSSVEMAFREKDNAQPPVTFEAKRADSEVAGGHAVWDSKPLGRIYWD